MTKIGLVYSRLRIEERMLLDAAERHGFDLTMVSDRQLVIDSQGGGVPGDVVLCRSLSANRALSILRASEAAGTPTVNRADVCAACMDKADTGWRLGQAGVPTPETRVAFDTESALTALEQVGYPAVLKPTQGSWARLIARVDNADQASQLLEHRAAMPSPQQHIYYVQSYVEKQNGAGHRDLRAFVVGDETVAAVWRMSDHWITNTARGATTEPCPVDDTLHALCQRAADAVGGGVLAVDLMETPDGLTVHEVNHSMEFRNSVAVTGIDIPRHILRYTEQEAHR